MVSTSSQSVRVPERQPEPKPAPKPAEKPFTIKIQGLTSGFSGKANEAASVFGQILPLIERALVSNYRLPPRAASEVEQRLYDWFQRFCRRPGSRRPESLRSELLLMACRAGHVYSVSQLEEFLASDELLKRSLTLGPEVIAIEIEKGLDKSRSADPAENEP
jgi:hypothetical protein